MSSEDCKLKWTRLVVSRANEVVMRSDVHICLLISIFIITIFTAFHCISTQSVFSCASCTVLASTSHRTHQTFEVRPANWASGFRRRGAYPVPTASMDWRWSLEEFVLTYDIQVAMLHEEEGLRIVPAPLWQFSKMFITSDQLDLWGRPPRKVQFGSKKRKLKTDHPWDPTRDAVPSQSVDCLKSPIFPWDHTCRSLTGRHFGPLMRAKLGRVQNARG